MKSMRLPVLMLGLLVAAGCFIRAVQGSGIPKTETRALPAFTKVTLTGSPDVEVSVGPVLSVVVTTDDNILPLITTKVEDNTLEIGCDTSYSTSLGVKVKITMPTVEGLTLTGSGNLHATGVKSGAIRTSLTGSGDLTVNGSCDKLDADLLGSGNLRAIGLDAKEVRVTVTGSGNATVHATDKLDAQVTGSGDVRYAGRPGSLTQNVTGSGDIRAQ